ncbi:bifunctional molybdenum cofactor biosynthesis protein MoaC/MoaB [Membranihabitans maritimus]|uniref:bifunctional molybdenum cofactor biosynthesis protein MoaC/MoaB n=1 Tax=Membranihabitans maritimus TaxID=2904244 RepID=UPI001EFFA125|nr:bifunctional molybdenum cofactor biosynthesis protein MoaC/MoaB [Membranihabitans maritimus]
MEDITGHISTLKKVVAQSNVTFNGHKNIQSLWNEKIEGTVKSATLLALKNTHQTIPGCHNTAIDAIEVNFSIMDNSIEITVIAKTVSKAPITTQAMHGLSIAGLVIYDTYKDSFEEIEIQKIKVTHQHGDQASYGEKFLHPIKASVIVCSDSIHAGTKKDKAGKAIIAKLEECGVGIEHYEVIADEMEDIREKAKAFSRDSQLIIYTGGTGLSVRDSTPEALTPLLDRRIPGIEEAIRSYGQDRMPYSMLSRSVAGTLGNCLVLALPGSTKGASESMDAIFPHLLHVFKIFRGARHD